MFKINAETGRITVASETGLDISNMNNDVITLSVEASDGTGSQTVNVKIAIRDVNNNKPIFSKEQYAASIQENAKPGTIILNFEI